MKESIFVFDLDGVIVDTKQKLYQLYIRFLKSLGKTVDAEECSALDGLKIAEIIAYAKKKYGLRDTEEELLRRYNQEIEKIYENVSPIENVIQIIRKLRAKNYKIALASSSKRENINVVLEKFELNDSFDYIISGDDVLRAKPSPEIYNLIRNHLGDHEYYVIEDSHHGLAAAAQAKMQVIFFNPESQKAHSEINYDINRMDEIKDVITEIEQKCKRIALAHVFNVEVQESEIHITKEQQKIVEEFWEERRRKNKKLFNGKILCYHSHLLNGEVLTINCYNAEYKYYFAQLHKNVSLGLQPLAVSGVIVDEGNNTLLARRSMKVTEYPHYYEFMPSGGLSGDDLQNNQVNFQKRLVIEFEEETNLSPSVIKEVVPICLILDKKNNVYDICSMILVQGKLGDMYKDNFSNEEYLSPLIIPLEKVFSTIDDKKMVPTSSILYPIVRKKLHLL